MTGTEASNLAMTSADLVPHLLADLAVKAVIVLVAVVLLALGMTLLWRRVGKGGDRRGGG
ncbi:hypothetical protein [Streptomyces sp. NPDC048650]|uniref:hypothetical protein n=1 Tax=unclassified Streptomyces TaxID=2593676 RepID=UPI003716F3A8